MEDAGIPLANVVEGGTAPQEEQQVAVAKRHADQDVEEKIPEKVQKKQSTDEEDGAYSGSESLTGSYTENNTNSNVEPMEVDYVSDNLNLPRLISDISFANPAALGDVQGDKVADPVGQFELTERDSSGQDSNLLNAPRVEVSQAINENDNRVDASPESEGQISTDNDEYASLNAPAGNNILRDTDSTTTSDEKVLDELENLEDRLYGARLTVENLCDQINALHERMFDDSEQQLVDSLEHAFGQMETCLEELAGIDHGFTTLHADVRVNTVRTLERFEQTLFGLSGHALTTRIQRVRQIRAECDSWFDFPTLHQFKPHIIEEPVAEDKTNDDDSSQANDDGFGQQAHQNEYGRQANPEYYGQNGSDDGYGHQVNRGYYGQHADDYGYGQQGNQGYYGRRANNLPCNSLTNKPKSKGWGYKYQADLPPATMASFSVPPTAMPGYHNPPIVGVRSTLSVNDFPSMTDVTRGIPTQIYHPPVPATSATTVSKVVSSTSTIPSLLDIEVSFPLEILKRNNQGQGQLGAFAQEFNDDEDMSDAASSNHDIEADVESSHHDSEEEGSPFQNSSQ